MFGLWLNGQWSRAVPMPDGRRGALPEHSRWGQLAGGLQRWPPGFHPEGPAGWLAHRWRSSRQPWGLREADFSLNNTPQSRFWAINATLERLGAHLVHPCAATWQVRARRKTSSTPLPPEHRSLRVAPSHIAIALFGINSVLASAGWESTWAIFAQRVIPLSRCARCILARLRR